MQRECSTLFHLHLAVWDDHNGRPYLIEMKDFAEKLYKSKTWQKCRQGYIKSVGGLCEKCLEQGRYAPAVIVHHKIPITANNINDPNITLNWDNLQAVCRDCHTELHTNRTVRYKVDELGRITAR